MGFHAIFVFGSNLAGRHGAGAAKYAMQAYGAIYGLGEGRQGQSYAIPTKDKKLRTRPLADIAASIRTFAAYAAEHHDEAFVLTPIGCGMAGCDPRDIWAILHQIGLPTNVVLHSSWVNDHAMADPVSKTPTLDAMAMQRAWYAAGIRAAALRYRAGSGPDSWDYFALAEAAILDLLTFERVEPPLPSPAAALAEAMRLPEVKERLEDDVTHSDDVAVNRFARAMKAKLAQARATGRSGWDDPAQCSEAYLAKQLVAHLGKGNPGTFEDVANFAMMLHQRGANPCVLKQAISVLPAPDPVSLTPTLDAMAMRRAAIAMCRDVAENAISVPVGRAFKRMSENMVGLPMPSPADALREAVKLSEVKALVETSYAAIDALNATGSTYQIVVATELDAAIAALKGASHE